MFSRDEEQELTHAIAAAERGSTGELRLVVVDRCKGDVLEEAKRQFVVHGLEKTKGRTGVLLFVCMKSHKIAILGDEGVHTRVGDRFWRAVIDRSITHFKSGEPLLGLLSAVDEIGGAFRRHLPGETAEGNELPDRPHFN